MKQVVGIDVSKAKLDCLWLKDTAKLKIKTKVIENNSSGLKALPAWLVKTTKAQPEDILVVMEATGIYHENLAYTLYERGFKVYVVNPAQVKAYAKSLGNTHKTDKKDSQLLARMGAERSLRPWQPEPPEIRKLKALLGRLEALEKDWQRESNRLEKAQISCATDLVIESIQNMIKQLSEEKKRLENQIDDHIDRHPQLKRDKALLETIPGVGSVISRLMLSVIHSRSFEKAEQVAAYLGLIPAIVESGTFKGKTKLSKAGSGYVRAKLYLPAVSATHWNPDIIRLKKRLLKKGKVKMQIVGAAMRKLVHLCFGVLKNQKEYSPQAV